MSKIKAVVCPETNRRSRIHGMLCADEVLGVLLEEWSRDFAGAVETRIRRLAVTHDRRVDGMLELSDFAAVVEGAWDPEAKGGAELSPGSLARMYSAVAEACHASGAQPGKITHDCLLEAARFFGWGATQSSSPSQHKGVPKVTAFPALWEAVGAQLEFMLAGLKGLKASGSSAAVDTAPAEVLMGRCKEAAAAGAGKDAQWDAFKSLVASIAEAATNAFRRLPAHQPTEESSSKGKAKDKKKVSNAAGTLSSQQQPEVLGAHFPSRPASCLARKSTGQEVAQQAIDARTHVH